MEAYAAEAFDVVGTMPFDFSYLIEKIATAEFSSAPFTHLEIKDFLSPEHFALVTHDPQISIDSARDTEQLIVLLKERGYEIIPFPGCITDPKQYLEWYNGASKKKVHGATEGFGIVFRLDDFRSATLTELNSFLMSDEFINAVKQKFGISETVDVDGGIQKYLHGYEISPHPDIRRKALTWMLNINPDSASERNNYHTHYMKFKDKWAFIPQFWRGNKDYDRDWVPWEWCETVKQQTQNNSIVIFSPSDDTIHAVKANYDHLSTQRTQIYGNLWYKENRLKKVSYKQLDIEALAKHAGRHKERFETFKNAPIGKSLLAVRDMIRPKKDHVRKLDV